ncbi:MAG TPA: phage gp6-like head-tail connector protein [Pseudonocardia sp.]
MAWAPAYVDPEDLNRFVRVDDTVDDVEAGLAIEAASRAVDAFTGRQFGLVDAAEARRYTARPRSGRWVADIDDLMTVVGLAVEGPSGAVTGYDLMPVNAAQEGRPWTRLAVDGVCEVTVTAQWGWTVVPEPVKQATLLQASRFLARRDSPYGIAGSPDQGSELRLLSRVDPDVAVILGPYVRRGFVFA